MVEKIDIIWWYISSLLTNLPLTFCAAWPNEFGDQTLQPPKQFAGMGETQPIFPKITKSLRAASKCLSLVSLFCFITARRFVFVGEAIRTPHIGIFLPRLIYLQGNLFGGHKISPRKIPTKFITGPVPLIHSLGQQCVAGLGTRVLFFTYHKSI